MKRLIALSVAAIMLAAALAGCASPQTSAAISTNIRTTSSDALDAAAWLTERLGDKLTDRVVLGTDADGYGVDVSALEDDGYFIRSFGREDVFTRSFGREDVLFAKTVDGLDRAARKYAKMVETNSVADVTYHEGARVKRLTLAGRDISEYTVFCEDEKYMLASANEFAARIKQANGAELAVVTGEPSAPYILLKYVHDESLANVGFRWSITADGLTIECSDKYKAQSSATAVARFLEKKLDWLGLSSGFEDLTPAECVSIDVGENGGETPAFLWDSPYIANCTTYDGFDTNRFSLGPQIHACHGMMGHGIAGELSNSAGDIPWTHDQPCYLDEEFYEVSLEDVTRIIKSYVAAGRVIGEDFQFLDIAAGDNFNWCQCKKCQDMFRAEGGAYSASVLTWANRLIDEVEQTYPGLYYGIFAYAGTNRPPKTIVPHESIIITYCYDNNCSAHTFSGEDCTGNNPKFNPVGVATKDHDNITMSAQLRRWTEISNKVVVWYYALLNGMLTMDVVHNIRADIRFLADLGIVGTICDGGENGFGTEWLFKWLADELMWDPYMSDREYDALYDRMLYVLYGDAAPTVKVYIETEGNFHENGECVCCWFWGFMISPSLPQQWWSKYFDEMFALTEYARTQANSELQQHRLDDLSCSCIYKGVISSYLPAYGAYDDERVAELCRRYSLIDERLSSYGVDMEVAICKEKTELKYDRDFELFFWREYTNSPGYVTPWFDYFPDRPMPERIAAILAESEG